MSNPLIESLGKMLTEEEFLNIIEALPKSEYELPEELSLEDKLALSSYITDVYCPPPNAYELYQAFYTGIYNSLDVKYGTKSVSQIRTLHEIATGENNKPLASFVSVGKILFVIGKPRSGKSELVGRCLSCIEQVFYHKTYNQEIFAEVQVNFVMVEYQYNDSLLQLYEALIAQICQVTGKKMMLGFGIKPYSLSTLEVLENTIVRMCLGYHIGAIVIEDLNKMIDSETAIELLQFLERVAAYTGTFIVVVSNKITSHEVSLTTNPFWKTTVITIDALCRKPEYAKALRKIWKVVPREFCDDLTEEIIQILYEETGGHPGTTTEIIYNAVMLAIQSNDNHLTQAHIFGAIEHFN